MLNPSLVTIDVAKTYFQVFAADAKGRRIFERSVTREQLRDLLHSLPPCVVAMEACSSAHFWARLALKHGHDVRLLAGHHVKRFVVSNKSDKADARAIAVAAVQPDARFVAVKSAHQLDLQAIIRVRDRLVRGRTALCNEMRALLYEQGIVVKRSRHAIAAFVQRLLRDEIQDEVTPLCRQTLAELGAELLDVDSRIETAETRLKKCAEEDAVCERLMTIPGVGLLTAVAVRAAAADGRGFKNGRHFAASIGLVPAHTGTGGKIRLLGISKRGNRYLRTLLVHGARAVLKWAPRKSDRTSAWATQLLAKKGWNKAAIAVANKNARILWALLKTGESYDVNKLAAA